MCYQQYLITKKDVIVKATSCINIDKNIWQKKTHFTRHVIKVIIIDNLLDFINANWSGKTVICQLIKAIWLTNQKP